MANGKELAALGLVVGRITAVDEHPGSRAPSFLVTVDLGGAGSREASITAGAYARDELLGRQVVCVPEGDGAVVIGAHSRETGLVLLVPEREVEDGSAVA